MTAFIQWQKLRKYPTRILIGSFATIILVGGILLTLPLSACGPRIKFIDALFTATSAVCVTGLTVCDTGTAYSTFGHVVILLLIQLGGLGITTLSTALLLLFGQRTSLSNRDVVEGSYLARPKGKLKTLLLQIFVWAFFIEAIGVLLLLPTELSRLPAFEALWIATFHSVSAFCNAGFSLWPDNLMGFRSDPAVILPISGLIILGGLGFSVITEIGENLWNRIRGRSIKRFSLHTKTALVTTGLLLFVGTFAFWILEKKNLLNGTDLISKLMISFFASVTPRTAGFNSIDYSQATAATIFFTMALMAIGGCPGSTAGGVKVTTLAVLFASARARMRGSRWPSLFGRGIPQVAVDKAFSVVAISMVFVVIGTLLLSAIGFSILPHVQVPGQPVGILFEVISALCTTGLSTGITSTLSAGGKIIVILLMFLGRLGPLTIAVAVARHKPAPSVRLAEEPIMIG